MSDLPSPRAAVALLIGVGAYRHADRIEPLRFARRDAKALGRLLADPATCGFPPEQVVCLTDGRARRDRVVSRLSKWLPEQGKGAELVFLYFAGHGAVGRVGQNEEGYLLPYDADPDDVVTRGIAMTDLARWIGGIEAKAVVVCLDCCHAGRILERQPGSARDLELRPALLQAIAGKGRFFLESCDEGQKSLECDDLKHGLFTYHLLRGIAGAGDRDGDGRVGLAELFNYVSAAVAKDAREKFGCEQKPWTSATWTEEVFVSFPGSNPPRPVDSPSGSRKGTDAVLDRDAPEEEVADLLRRLRQRPDPAYLPPIFRCLAHRSETVRRLARNALRALGWSKATPTLEDLARQGRPEDVGAILDGLAAFESHPEVVRLLDRLVVLLKGDLRNRAILQLERKRLGLGLEKVTALFKEIHSPYRIEKVLGQGLFTAAYLARIEGMDLDVVVRVLRPEFVGQPQILTHFLDVAGGSLRYVHQNLVLTREVRSFADRGVYYAVRDYVSGVTLQQALQGGKKFEPPQIVEILGQILAALTPLHRAGACHGGIKPSNIFLCDDNRVILGDASPLVQGIGLALDRLSYDYRYAPPEAFRSGAGLEPASDFYSLGCVVYELVWGKPPFVSDNYLDLAACHARETIRLPMGQGSVPRALSDSEEFLRRLLAPDAAHRFGSLEEAERGLAGLRKAMENWGVRRWQDVPLLAEASVAKYDPAHSLFPFGGAEAKSLETQTGGPPPAAASAAPLPEQVGRFEIEEVLGRGGMGTVYKAYDRQLDRAVVLKTLHSELRTASGQGDRFLTEYRALARLRHPNIVQIHDVGEFQGEPYLVMEFVGGGTLAEHRQRFVNEPRLAAELIAKVARAVQHAHEIGIIHRDLKPANVLLDERGEPKVGDFGLAKRTDEDMSQTLPGTILGTPSHMPPEQARGGAKEVGPAADVYALGATLYELLTGAPPFREVTALETLRKVIYELPQPPAALNPKVAAGLEAICLKCLEKDPANRYPSARALADDLDAWLKGDPVMAKAARRGLWRQLARLLPFGKESPADG
jgi:serine/threonine protein kinase